MPNYPIFYTVQNDKDSSTNVFSLNFSEEKSGSELKLKHIIQEFPLDLENGSYHIRFKIQCGETEPKIYAWIDPSNLDARAPIINNAVYVKILMLTKEGDSKLYNKQKILSAKQSVTKQSATAQVEKQPKNPPQVPSSSKANKQTSHHNDIHHSRSNPDLVHNKHISSQNFLDEDHKDGNHYSQFRQKSSQDLDKQQQQQQQQAPPVQQPKQTKNIFDDDDDHFSSTPTPVQQSNTNQDPPRSGVMNFLDSDDDSMPNNSQNNLGSNSNANKQPQNNASHPGTNQDLFDNDNPAIVQQHVNFMEGHTKPPLSEFEIELKARENEYIINGEMIQELLIKVKGDINKKLQDDRVKEHERQQQIKLKEQDAKRDAKEKLEAKVKSWKESNGARKDIRTLLSTLQNVLWSDAQWTPVSFFDLSTEENLKSTVKKVLLKFHPDRNRNNIENKYICEQIIDEIKQAEKEYQNKQQK